MNQKRLFNMLLAGMMIWAAHVCTQPLDSVVKIFTVASVPSYDLPWIDNDMSVNAGQ